MTRTCQIEERCSRRVGGGASPHVSSLGADPPQSVLRADRSAWPVEDYTFRLEGRKQGGDVGLDGLVEAAVEPNLRAATPT